jgi:hypothetical protein
MLRGLAGRLGPRCSCGAPRRRLARLATVIVRRMLIGFAWTGLTSTSCSGPLLESVRRWSCGLVAEAPCCPRALAPVGTSRSLG